MKILYFHQYFATPDTSAGTRSYEMSRRLVRDNNEVVLLTTSAFLERVYDFDPGWNILKIDGIEVHVLKLPYSNSNGFFQRVYKFLYFSVRSFFKSLKFEADLVFATSTPLTIVIPALLYKTIKKKPMVFEVRDLWPELPIAVGAIKNPLLIKLAEWLEHLAYKYSRKVIALSPGMLAGVKKKGKPVEDIVNIPNGCDVEYFRVAKEVGEEYIKQNLPFLQGRKLVVYTGTLGAINDVSYLVDVANECQKNGHEICFYVVGDGAEKELIRSKAQALGVLNENFFMGEPKSKKEIVKILSAADLALSLFGNVTEMWANSANKFFDALASGTPVVINYQGWQYDLINEQGCGLCIDYFDYESAALALNDFLFEPSRYQSAVVSACKVADDNFSREKLYAKFSQTIYEAAK